MLALREMRISTPHPELSLLDLPDEVLDHIVDFVYVDSGSYLRSIIPLSLACRRLRKATLPILFHIVTLVSCPEFWEDHSYKLLKDLMSPEGGIAQYVHHIKMIKPVVTSDSVRQNSYPWHALSVRQLEQAFSRLSSLKSVSLDCVNYATLILLGGAEAQSPLHIVIHGYNQPASMRYMQERNNVYNMLADTIVSHRLSISILPRWSPMWFFPIWRSHKQSVLAINWSPPRLLLAMQEDLTVLGKLDMLEELHLSPKNSIRYSNVESISQTIIKLKKLKRLSVSGTEFAEAVLRILSQLDQLEGLRLHSGSETLFHGHLNSSDREGLPYLSLPRLTELEIRYISRYLSIGHILSPGLQSLRLEYRERTDRLRAFDLRWMAQNVPNLECLEVNVGVLSNLWHPTAIAGVDVDVEVYQLLDALASFKKLRRLRLFPSYWKSQAGFLNFVQPVSDEQAVRIHQHLIRRIPELQLLIISNTHADYMLKQEIYARDATEPMKWVVRSCGTRSVLTTHQAGENYELEQVWEGEKRLTMKNIPHRYRHCHFDELHGWTVPAYEFPFDMPDES